MSGIYLHIPFCKQACHYCDFHFSTQHGKKEAMVKALHREIVLRKEEFQDHVVETVYFGGGTPSLLEVEEIKKLIFSVYENYKVAEHPEITLEANPDDLSQHTLLQLSKTPVNRLSMGIQSFFDEDLLWMNRTHSAQQAQKSLGEAKKYFSNISIDLIYGIPGMSNSRWISNIEKALTFELPHISGYALTVEPKTALQKFIEKGKVPNIDEKQTQEQFYLLLNRLEKEGYINYEISNFGKPGFFSRNNSLYWQGKKYIGIGPSAHSFNGKQRSWNIRNNTQYIKALEQNKLPREIETITQTEQYNEYIMTGLRTFWGVSLEEIQTAFGNTYREYLIQQAKKYIEAQLLLLHQGTLKATKKGKFLIDGIASDLFLLDPL